jgi:predicted phage replisome organizer
MAKKYYWLKLKADFFTSRAMKKIRRIAGGDTYTIIYLKLQLLSLKDEGLLFYEGVEPTFYEEMALALDEDAENVKVTLIFLENMGLIKQQNEHEYILTEVPYLIGGESESAERVRRYRERKALQCNTPVTIGNTEIEIEKEKEKDIELEIEGEKSKKVDYELVARMYNDTCVSFPRITTLSDARKKAIKARLNKYSLEDLQRLFTLAEASDFLKGDNKRNWSANFDWLIKDSNIAKVLDGNYNNTKANNSQYNSQYKANQTAQELDDFYNMASSWAESEG